ncbi:DUF1989 domain-containing protein [Geodermatophilus sp. SYSU D00815]
MSEHQVVDVPAVSGRAVRLAENDVLRVVDVEGQQVADLVAFTGPGLGERLSQGFTRMLHGSTRVGGPGARLHSDLGRPLLEIVTDPLGVHDLLYPPCNELYYREVHGLAGKTGCREHLTSALAPFGVPFAAVTDPFNVFMNTAVGGDGRPVIAAPLTTAGDFVELRALTDLVVGVSACAADMGPCNGGRCTGLRLVVNPPAASAAA